ncbi:MAG: KH domain-containing protein [Dehalococcoidia bacterium]
MKELIEFVARSIVEQPDAVEVEEESDGDRVILHLYVADDDMGKVIGKQGRIANAMRALVKVAAIRNDTYVNLEIGR